jgi:hypothetical protein
MNSDQIKNTMDHQRDIEGMAQLSDYEESRFEHSPSAEMPHLMNDRLEKLLKMIHQRVEEKYRDFRQAFRAIDKDFGGALEFKEFMLAMEEIGIKLRLGDFKLLFEALDYDQKGTIDFPKFCHLNADRYSLVDLIRMVSKQPLIVTIRGKNTSSHRACQVSGDHPCRLSQCQGSRLQDQRRLRS